MASTEWKETIPAGEPEKLEALASVLHGLQVKRAAGKPADRALHAKANAGLSAELRVAANVADALRVGIFGKPDTTYRAYVRYSNGSGTRGHDKKEDVRGIAVKLLGVPGKKIIPGMEAATTHDLLLIRSPSTPTRTGAALRRRDDDPHRGPEHHLDERSVASAEGRGARDRLAGSVERTRQEARGLRGDTLVRSLARAGGIPSVDGELRLTADLVAVPAKDGGHESAQLVVVLDHEAVSVPRRAAFGGGAFDIGRAAASVRGR